MVNHQAPSYAEEHVKELLPFLGIVRLSGASPCCQDKIVKGHIGRHPFWLVVPHVCRENSTPLVSAAMTSNSSVSLSTTLDPLPPVLQRGLVAVAFFGIFSLVTSLGLFTFLTYRLCVWKVKGQLQDGPNQFLILIYNLVLADIQQAISFSLTSAYLAAGKIEVGTTTCWANGWFVSVGDLASGVFIFGIALHTFFAVVKSRRPSSRVFYSCIAVAWIFVYAMAIIGVGIDTKLYVRAGAWVCSSPSPRPAMLTPSLVLDLT